VGGHGPFRGLDAPLALISFYQDRGKKDSQRDLVELFSLAAPETPAMVCASRTKIMKAASGTPSHCPARPCRVQPAGIRL